ncbi:hypothetical protein GDO86_016157 [Hymenochirus boettgeri]|uniref:Protein TALPID3 n=1 Tax=Hymenochirus boettgeri TaxID=247094 RepID=A0A8T2K1X3_9PIPI|nr:hypothetical protein GDO86_016157 [Hymenochirus boettgeri]
MEDEASDRSWNSEVSTTASEVHVTKHLHAVDEKMDNKAKQDGNKKRHKDIEISRFTTGQKGALLTALNKRAQNGPVTKQVRVQLLEDTPAAAREYATQDGKNRQDNLDTVKTVAAATAAAIAATVPLLKAEKALEVGSVSQLENKLQEANRLLQQITEHQNKIQTPPTEVYHGERVRELEMQLAKLTEQRLQHLEKLQQQQIQMQSHFISSTMNGGKYRHQPYEVSVPAPIPVTVPQKLVPNQPTKISHSKNCEKEQDDSGKSPLETPAPRRFAPVPIAKDVGVPNIKVQGKENFEKSSNTMHLGTGVFLQKVLEEDGSTCFSSPSNTQMNVKKGYIPSYNDSFGVPPIDMDTSTKYFSQSTNPKANSAVKKANDVLHDLALLKQEMHGMLQLQPSLLSFGKPQKSMCDDAKRILRDVQNKKKVLEENLQAVARAKDGVDMYSLIDSLVTDSNAAEKIRIKKTVGDWIAKMDIEIQTLQEMNESLQVNEELLNRVYGRPTYQGQRSTLKKDPYLRFNSPSPKSKPRRPRVVEIVRAEPRFAFCPSKDAMEMSSPIEGHLIPMAIPLGRSQSKGNSPVPYSVIITQPQTTTVNVSIPPSSPKLFPKTVKPNIAVVEMKSEIKDPSQLTVQVLPCVDIDSIASDSISQEVTPSPSIPPPSKPDIQLPVHVDTEEEVLQFPGSSFVQVIDITQDDVCEDEVPEPLIQVNGWSEIALLQYHGIPFPPDHLSPVPQVATDILEGIITRKESLENRLFNRVEQEIMAQILNGIHPMRQDAISNISTSDTEKSGSISSDIVEAAGGEGLQLFVDAGLPVDSILVRQYVEEALAEMIAIMLGERESQNMQKSPPRESVLQVTDEISLVPTPVSTPPMSPLLHEKEFSIVKTPELSPQPSVAEPVFEEDQADNTGDRQAMEIVKTPFATPVASPNATPPRAPTPASLTSEKQKETECPTPWNTTDRPLEEENPHSLREISNKDSIVMTVAWDEEPESLISAPSPLPEKSQSPLQPKPRSPSPIYSHSTAPSTDLSTLTVTITETETTDRPLSEGELLYSYERMAAELAVAKGGVVCPDFPGSLSSTLHDARDMEYDPPSEGQVIHGKQNGAHKDPVLSLLARFNQDLVTPLDACYPPVVGISSGSEEENSMGEISEGQRPRFTTAAEQVVVGHSALMGRASYANQAAGHHHRHLSSPGQYNALSGANPLDHFSSGPMSIGELGSHKVPDLHPHIDISVERPTVVSSTFQSLTQGSEEPQLDYPPIHTHYIQVKTSNDSSKDVLEDLDRTLVEPSSYLSSPLSEMAPGPSKRMSVIIPSMMDIRTTSESELSGSDL